MSFLTKLDTVVTNNNSLLCVGLDPDINKLPPHIASQKDAFFIFNKAIIDATNDLVCAYKPNSAMYEAAGNNGITQLKKTCDYINTNYPKIPIILDFKRADIGNTNNYYANFAFKYLNVDAITINPYMGKTANNEFLAYKDKGIIILCKTSNPGAGEFQDLIIDGKPLYQLVAKNVMASWDTNNNCLLVMGATYAEELAQVRKIVGPNMVFLVPGVGAQGGDVKIFVTAGLGANKRGLIINSSREVLYSSNDKDFAEAARSKALNIRNTINNYR